MPEEEEKGRGFSRSHMHLVITDPVNLTSAPQQVALCCFALAERADRNTMEAQIISCDGFTGSLFFWSAESN